MPRLARVLLHQIGLTVCVLGGLVLLGTTRAADPRADDDLSALQGNWKLLHCEYQGVPQMTAEVMSQVTAVFEKNQYHLYFRDRESNPDGRPRVYRLAVARVTLDPTSRPKAITFEFADGPLKGQQRHGIYELAGNQLRLCYGPAERPRPTEFKAGADSGYFLETWARQVK